MFLIPVRYWISLSNPSPNPPCGTVPYFLRSIYHSLINEFVVLVKESSIVSIIGIHDLMYNADTVRGNTYLAFEPLIIASIIYFVLTFSLSKLVAMFEKKLASSTI